MIYVRNGNKLYWLSFRKFRQMCLDIRKGYMDISIEEYGTEVTEDVYDFVDLLGGGAVLDKILEPSKPATKPPEV